jgi:starch synthase
MNILFASSEVAPFAKTGGLADVSGSLPRALSEISCRTSVILPFYKDVKNMHLEVEHFSKGEFDFLAHKEGGMEYIFVVNDKYYERDNLYSEPTGDYEDNDLRFSYFARAVAVVGIDASRAFDVVHCNDWQTGLVPLYLKIHGADVKTLFSIHNIGYQGLFKVDSLYRIGIPRRFYNINGIEYYGKVSFLKAGIVYSSAISTVSKAYSEEILTREFGCGMDGILRTRVPNIYGIVNGVDYTKWDPKIDEHIAGKYDSESIGKKLECKKDLIKSANLAPDTLERPLIGVISRLAHQKGIDLIIEAAKEIIDLGASVVILGIGDEKYNKLTRSIGEEHPGYISSHIKFDNELAHKIEAGSDMFVMPSRYEPCGLNQLYSMRYGTVPIVRATGGLNDTIIDVDTDKAGGNGIKFSGATKKDLIEAVSRAVKLYNDKSEWQKLQKKVMGLDFSWKASALHYKELYEKLIR